MIYLEITYAQKDEAKPFGVRWDPKEKLWYFPGDVLPEELERFRPANAPKGPVEKIILDIPFSYRDIAARAGVRWDSEIKACFFEKRPGQALPPEPGINLPGRTEGRCSGCFCRCFFDGRATLSCARHTSGYGARFAADSDPKK